MAEMTLQEARQIGAEKLGIGKDVFAKSLQIARDMQKDLGGTAKDLPPLTLILSLMGLAKAHEVSEDLEKEMTDAAELVSKAEREWRLEQQVGRGVA